MFAREEDLEEEVHELERVLLEQREIFSRVEHEASQIRFLVDYLQVDEGNQP